MGTQSWYQRWAPLLVGFVVGNSAAYVYLTRWKYPNELSQGSGFGISKGREIGARIDNTFDRLKRESRSAVNTMGDEGRETYANLVKEGRENYEALSEEGKKLYHKFVKAGQDKYGNAEKDAHSLLNKLDQKASTSVNESLDKARSVLHNTADSVHSGSQNVKSQGDLLFGKIEQSADDVSKKVSSWWGSWSK